MNGPDLICGYCGRPTCGCGRPRRSTLAWFLILAALTLLVPLLLTWGR